MNIIYLYTSKYIFYLIQQPKRGIRSRSKIASASPGCSWRTPVLLHWGSNSPLMRPRTTGRGRTVKTTTTFSSRMVSYSFHFKPSVFSCIVVRLMVFFNIPQPPHKSTVVQEINAKFRDQNLRIFQKFQVS